MTSKNAKKHGGAHEASPLDAATQTAGAPEAPASARPGTGPAAGVATTAGPDVGRDVPGAPPAMPATPADLEVALAEAREWKERAARAQAEFENTRKRLTAQQAEACARATDRVIEGLLPVIDDLDRAIAHGQETDNELTAGLSAIRDKVQAIFANEGVEVIDPQVGEPFDHETQSAMQMVANPDLPDMSVAQVFQKGYRRGARVIRPAAVIVSQS